MRVTSQKGAVGDRTVVLAVGKGNGRWAEMGNEFEKR